MSRSLGINKQRTPVVQEPPRGPISSIASAKNMSAAQQQQQQMLKQQYMQQQQQKLKQQQQQQQQQPQPQAASGMPSHVTVPQAIAVIVSRLNSIERKILKPVATLEDSEQQQQESIDLDLTIDQILERLQQLEGTNSLVVSKSDFEQLNNKVSKLDSDLRDSKDMVLKMQSMIITTTEQVTKLSMQVNTLSSEQIEN